MRLPVCAPMYGAGTREERWYGTVYLDKFFRSAYRPDSAFVDDAG